jgi:hypothetical protein
MTPQQTEEFIARLLAEHPDLCLDSRSIGRWSGLLAGLTSEQRSALMPLAVQHEAARHRARYGSQPFYAGWSDDDWLRFAQSYMPEELVLDPPWPTEFDRMRPDIQDITDPRNWPPHLVLPEGNDWVFVAEYPEVSAPISVPAQFWVAAKERSESDPFLAEHGRTAGLEMRYFLRCESDVPRVMLMRRENTLARYFTHLTDSGLEDLARVVAGRQEFRYVDRMIQARLRSQRQSRDVTRTKAQDEALNTKMKQPPEVIDPNDGVEAALEEVLARRSPQDRARTLLESSPKDAEQASEYPTNYDLAEGVMNQLRVQRKEPEIETEEDSIRAEAIRRERVRRMAQEAARRFPATPTPTSEEPLSKGKGAAE